MDGFTSLIFIYRFFFKDRKRRRRRRDPENLISFEDVDPNES
jgi:hypothetical protein